MDRQQAPVWLEPSTARAHAVYWRVAVIVSGALAFGYLNFLRIDRDFGFSAALATSAAWVIFLFALGTFTVRYWRTVRVFSEDGVVGRIDPLGMRHEIPVETVGRVVAVTVKGARTPAQQRWLFLDHAGRGLFVLNPAVWDSVALVHLLHRIGQQLDQSDTKPITIYAVSQLYPGTYPWYLARRWPIPVATTLLILFISAFLLAASGGHGRLSQ